MKTQALLVTAPDHLEMGEVEVPSPGEGEVLLDVKYSCISPGTELRTLSGQQSGAGPYPFVPGYGQVGKVIECGQGVSFEPGALVFTIGTKKCSANITWGAHVSHSVVPESAVFPLPEGVDPIEASAAKLAAISYHGSLLSRVQSDQTVVVVGLGPIGILSALFHKLAGARVVSADRSEARVRFVEEILGLKAFVPRESLAKEVQHHFTQGPDIIVDSTGVTSALTQCLEMARDLPWTDYDEPNTRLLLQGSYPAEFALDYNLAFLKEIELIVPRDHQPRDLRRVLQLLGEGQIHIRDIISRVVTSEEALGLYHELKASKGSLLTAAIEW
jgi:3-hydroxyethyl bacteriochlorophyllide a dehydrogenase